MRASSCTKLLEHLGCGPNLATISCEHAGLKLGDLGLREVEPLIAVCCQNNYISTFRKLVLQFNSSSMHATTYGTHTLTIPLLQRAATHLVRLG